MVPIVSERAGRNMRATRMKPAALPTRLQPTPRMPKAAALALALAAALLGGCTTTTPGGVPIVVRDDARGQDSACSSSSSTTRWPTCRCR
jgi:hypothetical protein